MSTSRMRLLAVALAIAGTTTAIASTAPAAPQAVVTAGGGMLTPPPPARFERRPPPRAGYVWAPGYWIWSQRLHRHVWGNGRWLRVRPGQRYVPARWWQGPHGHWHFSAGYWTR